MWHGIVNFLSGPGFSSGSNLLQYIGSIGLLSWVLHRWEHQCRATKFCLRTGQIPVEGTTWFTCPKHSVPELHHHMKARHARQHSGRLPH